MKAWIMVLALVLAAPVVAQAQSSVAKIEARDAWARLPVDGAKSTTAYLEIVNLTNTADRLLGASSAWADRVTLQHMGMEGYDMKTKVVPFLKIGGHKSIKLHPGEYQLKLEGLTQVLKPDLKIPITLRFENAGRVEIEASVSNQKLGNLDDR